MSGHRIYLLFDQAETLVSAARQLRSVPGLDAHAPFHIPELAAALDLSPSPVRPAMLVGGALGGLATLALQWWDRALRYPMNSGGRSDAPLPAYGFAVFEMVVLFAAFAGLLALLIGGRLGQLNHPFFATAQTERASDDLFYLSLPADAGPGRDELSALPGVAGLFEAPS